MSEYTYSIVVIDLVGDEEDEITLRVEKPEDAPEMCPYNQWELPLQIIEIE